MFSSINIFIYILNSKNIIQLVLFQENIFKNKSTNICLKQLLTQLFSVHKMSFCSTKAAFSLIIVPPRPDFLLLHSKLKLFCIFQKIHKKAKLKSCDTSCYTAVDLIQMVFKQSCLQKIFTKIINCPKTNKNKKKTS